jgi:hypothetical protein
VCSLWVEHLTRPWQRRHVGVCVCVGGGGHTLISTSGGVLIRLVVETVAHAVEKVQPTYEYMNGGSTVRRAGSVNR